LTTQLQPPNQDLTVASHQKKEKTPKFPSRNLALEEEEEAGHKRIE